MQRPREDCSCGDTVQTVSAIYKPQKTAFLDAGAASSHVPLFNSSILSLDTWGASFVSKWACCQTQPLVAMCPSCPYLWLLAVTFMHEDIWTSSLGQVGLSRYASLLQIFDPSISIFDPSISNLSAAGEIKYIPKYHALKITQISSLQIFQRSLIEYTFLKRVSVMLNCFIAHGWIEPWNIPTYWFLWKLSYSKRHGMNCRIENTILLTTMPLIIKSHKIPIVVWMYEY